MGATSRFSVGFPWHLPPAGSSARTHGRAWLAKAPPKALPWHLAPVQHWEGAKDTPLHSWGALGCLFTGSAGFVESRGRAGKCPELHHQLDGDLGLGHPQRNSGGKIVTPGRELEASSPDCRAPLASCLVEKRNKLKTWREKNLLGDHRALAGGAAPARRVAQEWGRAALRDTV